MKIRAHRALAIAFVLALALATAAFAGPLRGKTYVGGLPSRGTNSRTHHPVPLHAGGNIQLHVSGNGRTVTVHFTSSYPLIYCNTKQRLRVQTGHAARISSHGSFKAYVSERFAPGPGPPAIVQAVTGHFTGGSVRGTIQTRAGDCSGSSHYSARAH